MWTILKNRFRQGYRTSKFPKGSIDFPKHYRGLPKLEAEKCPQDCKVCLEVCPTHAIQLHPLSIDLGACLFCPLCEEACPKGAIHFTSNHRLGTFRREDLHTRNRIQKPISSLDSKIQKQFGRSLHLRHVSAGGCNSCEADLAVLQTVTFDLQQFGIQLVASPRHADGIIITGPVTQNMQQALLETYHAVPSPKIVIALGSCAIQGGPFFESNACVGVPKEIPVDLFVPGCPPHPYSILEGLLTLLGKTDNLTS